MTLSFSKLGAMIALILAVTAASAMAIEEPIFVGGRGPGPGFNRGGGAPGPGFNRGPDFERRPGFERDRDFDRRPGFDRDRDFDGGFRPGFSGRGWGPGFPPAYYPGNGYGPVFVPGPGFAPGFQQGYVYTCFATAQDGTPFYATGYDPNLTQQQAYGYCAQTGLCCQPTGCR